MKYDKVDYITGVTDNKIGLTVKSPPVESISTTQNELTQANTLMEHLESQTKQIFSVEKEIFKNENYKHKIDKDSQNLLMVLNLLEQIQAQKKIKFSSSSIINQKSLTQKQINDSLTNQIYHEMLWHQELLNKMNSADPKREDYLPLVNSSKDIDIVMKDQ